MKPFVLIIGSTLIASGPAAAQSPPESVTDSVGVKLKLIPAGEFLMGSTDEDIRTSLAEMKARRSGEWYQASPPSEGPRHKVRITRPFYLGVYEVTVGQYRAFVEATGYKTLAERDGKGGYGRTVKGWARKAEFNWKSMGFERADDHPVVNVAFEDAEAFCKWLTRKEGVAYRLPTEAEWEYACRAGTTTRSYWGDDAALRDQYVWHGGNSKGRPQPVGRLKPNAWGLYDMCGNVYEYCSDRYSREAYKTAAEVDPPGPVEGNARVVRGGSWGTDPIHCRSAFRGDAGPDHYNQRDGFRVVRVVK